MTGVQPNVNGIRHESATDNRNIKTGVNGQPRMPYIEIVEQPASKALRFRYECEGRSAGSIPGVHNTSENKTYPTIRIVGYKGRAVIVVSCVTKDEPYRAHPHNLVGKEGCKNGICTMEVNNENMTAVFSNLGIQCVKKKDIEEALKIREEIRVDPFRQGFAHSAHPSSIDLNAVRLCFQAFLDGSEPKKFNILTPVVSDPIYDKKAMSDLIITKLSHSYASVKGGQEVILLCEKVAKEDIQVRFYEESNGQVTWEGFGDFTPSQVHKQVAISFKTPPYKHTEVDQKIKVFIQLKRPSDGTLSDPLPFHFVPDSGKLALCLLHSFENDHDFLAKVSFGKQATLINEFNPRHFISDDDDIDNDVDKCAQTERENANECAYSKSEDVITLTDSDDEQNEEKENRSENVDDSRNDKLLFDRYDEAKSTGEFTSEEAFDNLSMAGRDKLRELGVVFSECEGGEALSERINSDAELLGKRSSKTNDTKTEARKKERDYFGVQGSLRFAIKHTMKLPERKLSLHSPKAKHRSPHREMVPPPRPVAQKPELKETSSIIDGETLPPIPPKRVKKNQSVCRALPELPDKGTKVALFQKLFFLKKKKQKMVDQSQVTVDSDKKLVRRSMSEFQLSNLQDDLTEAEHYALYTDLAPRATVSEFDESSCYYSPVEMHLMKEEQV